VVLKKFKATAKGLQHQKYGIQMKIYNASRERRGALFSVVGIEV
jgi:hypothetical protein